MRSTRVALCFRTHVTFTATPQGQRFLAACDHGDPGAAERLLRHLPHTREVYTALLSAYEHSGDTEGAEGVLRRADLYLDEGSFGLREARQALSAHALAAIDDNRSSDVATRESLEAGAAALSRLIASGDVTDAARHYIKLAAAARRAGTAVPGAHNILRVMLARARTVRDVVAAYDAGQAYRPSRTRLAHAMHRLTNIGELRAARKLYERSSPRELRQCHVVAHAYLETHVLEARRKAQILRPAQALSEGAARGEYPDWWTRESVASDDTRRYTMPRVAYYKCVKALRAALEAPVSRRAHGAERAYTALLELMRMFFDDYHFRKRVLRIRGGLSRMGLNVKCLREALTIRAPR